MAGGVFKVLFVSALLVAAVVAMEVEADADVEEAKPRAPKAPRNLIAPKIDRERRFGTKHVVIVPKGDPRAYPPTATANAMDVSPPAGYFAPGDAPIAPAAGSPAVLKAAAPGAGCTAISGRCIAKTACTGANSIQTGLCPGATYCCVPSAPIPAGGIGSKIAASANTVCASYHASGAVYSQPNRQFGMSVKYSDCSSFVQSVFENAGYSTIFGRANAQTQAMRNIIARRGGGYHKTGVLLGDLVMWSAGSTGHVGIITKICTPTTFQLTAMGNKGCGPYPLGGGCMTWQQMTAYGLGGAAGFQGYWTPH